MKLIQTITLGTAATEITFSDINLIGSGYTHLYFKVSVDNTSTVTNNKLAIKLNGNTSPLGTNNVLIQSFNGASLTSATYSSYVPVGVIPGTAYSSGEVYVLDFNGKRAASNKSIISSGNNNGTSASTDQGSWVSCMRQTASLNYIMNVTFYNATTTTNTFQAGSSISMYAI